MVSLPTKNGRTPFLVSFQTENGIFGNQDSLVSFGTMWYLWRPSMIGHLLGDRMGWKTVSLPTKNGRTPFLVSFPTEGGIFWNQDCLVSFPTKMVSLATSNDWTPFIF